jgi:hypothetical protein
MNSSMKSKQVILHLFRVYCRMHHTRSWVHPLQGNYPSWP